MTSPSNAFLCPFPPHVWECRASSFVESGKETGSVSSFKALARHLLRTLLRAFYKIFSRILLRSVLLHTPLGVHPKERHAITGTDVHLQGSNGPEEVVCQCYSISSLDSFAEDADLDLQACNIGVMLVEMGDGVCRFGLSDIKGSTQSSYLAAQRE